MDSSIEHEAYYMAIRKALVAGNAAVMVGAGFSRNAIGGAHLKTWAQLGDVLWEELNPGSNETPGFSSSLVTQLGEQYARVFSTPALEDLLKKNVPDDKVAPGKIHESLLQLPWAEIFTTNYDTLIERASENIVDRAHSIVTCREDIPQSKVLGRRRIVKLHGSFPSQRPFIFTEEDYRCYPEKFAPFVNLVRQSLLENVFCLIGFSGDDPNFLHWIGWVRDMLDRHALPIYLFVGDELSLGQRKLLEARQVTPVVLPLKKGVKPDDFGSRYQQLFEILAKPLKPSDMVWGRKIKLPDVDYKKVQDVNERYKYLISCFPILNDLRKSYPGWLIAPESIRYRIKINLRDSGFDVYELYEAKSEKEPLMCLVFMCQYSWINNIILMSFDDHLAEIGIELILKVSDLGLDKLYLNEEKSLRAVGVSSVKDLSFILSGVLISLLVWSRQGLHKDKFLKIKNSIETNFKDNHSLIDHISYESILMALYEGEKDIARLSIFEWNIASSDFYMMIRKGALLAEVGELELALKVCIEGLQGIRKNQKQNSDNQKYLSEEAWACLIIDNIQMSLQHSKLFDLSKTVDQYVDKDDLSERMNRRLSDLATKGFDVRGELNEIFSGLNAEAKPPSKNIHHSREFFLGKKRQYQTSGRSFALVEKINSAFSFLNLIDRVALPPIIGNFNFYVSSCVQAAWWVQYNDSMRRVISVVVRTLSVDVLKPRDDSKAIHETGWLSRYQIAKIDSLYAKDVCRNSLNLVARVLSPGAPSVNLKRDIERLCIFHLDMFSRMIIRVASSDVRRFYKKLISLFKESSLKNYERLWEAANRAILGCFDSLSIDGQNKLVCPLLSILHLKRSNSFSQWLPFVGFYIARTSKGDSQKISNLLDIEVNQIFSLLEKSNTVESNIDKRDASKAWEALSWLNDLGLLSETQKNIAGKIIWNGKKSWPLVTGFHDFFALRWPAPSNTDAHEVFINEILKKELVGFGVPSSMIITSAGSENSWGFPVNDSFLINCNISLSQSPWSPEQLNKLVQIFKRWWDKEWPAISSDLSSVAELEKAFFIRMDKFDEILGKSIFSSEKYYKNFTAKYSSAKEWIDYAVSIARDCGVNFWRYDFFSARMEKNHEKFSFLQRKIVEVILNSENNIYSDVAEKFLLSASKSNFFGGQYVPAFILGSLSHVVASRRMPSLNGALNVLISIADNQPKWITDDFFSAIEIGLKQLLVDLSYSERPIDSDIPDDEVPILRVLCARLAFTLRKSASESEVINEWISASDTDPLPEMRYLAQRNRLN